MKSIKQYLLESLRSYNKVTSGSLITEADASKKRDLIFQFLKKKLDIAINDKLVVPRKVNGQAVMTYWGMDYAEKREIMLVGFNFDKNGSLYSVDFYKPKDFTASIPGVKAKSALSIFANGNSSVSLLPTVLEVCKTRKFDLTDEKATQLTIDTLNGEKKTTEESEQLDEAPIRRTKEIHDLLAKKWKDKEDALADYKTDRTSKEKKIVWKNAVSEWNKIWAAVRDNNAQTVEEVELLLKKNVEVETSVSPELEKAEEEVQKKIDEYVQQSENKADDKAKEEDPKETPAPSEKEAKKSLKDLMDNDEFKIPEGMTEFEYNPENKFRAMCGFIAGVAKGFYSLCILCGAPGVGKTFRIRKKLKELGYEEGKNYTHLKGKVGPKALYAAMFKYKEQGQIVFLDDVDTILASADGKNILKAACDTTVDDDEDEGREYRGHKISYATGQHIKDIDGNDIPNEFYYKGGIIVATNKSPGQLESAIKDRAKIMVMNFDPEQIFMIIYNILGDLQNATKTLTDDAKRKAFSILRAIYKEGKMKDMKLSCRSLIGAAETVMTFDGVDDDALVLSAVKDYLVSLSAKGGKMF